MSAFLKGLEKRTIQSGFFFILIALILFPPNSHAVWGEDDDYYLQEQWNDIKRKYVPEIVESIRKSYSTLSCLQQYYRKKYPSDELESTEEAVSAILPSFSENEQEQAVKEILSFHHVVYHETQWHKMDQNVEICRRYEKIIDKYSALYDVPPSLAKAIICWENSGDVANISYAECAGLGQLSWGAVQRAHDYGHEIGEYAKAKAKICDFLYESTGKEIYKKGAGEYRKERESAHIGERHKKLAGACNTDDERLVPECNIEDTVAFIKVMLNYYDGRPDMAIASYHNGVSNMDELLGHYIGRWMPWMLKGKRADRNILLKAVKKYDIDYLTLWNDDRCREMLSGYRTMDGEITNESNKCEALGDESDIYIWKVLAACGALDLSSQSLNSRMERYGSRWDVTECRGLHLYSSYEEIKDGIKKGCLVKMPPVYQDLGIGNLPSPSSFYLKNLKQYNYYVTPELAGFLHRLCSDLRGASGSPKGLIPIQGALESKLISLESASLDHPENRTHLQGVAFDCTTGEGGEVLRSLLKRYYLMDRIYLIYEDNHYHVCLNPRYGKEYYQFYTECELKYKKK